MWIRLAFAAAPRQFELALHRWPGAKAPDPTMPPTSFDIGFSLIRAQENWGASGFSGLLSPMQRNACLKATIVTNYAAVSAVLDNCRGRSARTAEPQAIGFGGDALVSAATCLDPATIRQARR